MYKRSKETREIKIQEKYIDKINKETTGRHIQEKDRGKIKK